MDSFEWNKTLMAILCALLLIKTVDLIATHLIRPVMLSKNVYIVQGVEVAEAPVSKAEVYQPIEPLLAQANVANGQKVAKLCMQCHTLDKGGKHINGPNLWNVGGRKTGGLPDYPYSTAMKAHPGNWDVESLNHFLTQPRAFVNGTKMSFVGLKKIEDRRDVIAYLETLKD